MANKHKVGVHVSAQQRNNYGVSAPHLVSAVSFDPGAFDELPEQAIKIFRTHAVPNHKDAPGDFDQLRDDQLFDAAIWWWTEHLEPIYRPIKEKYGDVYFQPTNEINSRRILLYLDGMIEAAERDGYKLALLGDAGDSPEWGEWYIHWLPWLKKHGGRGHIYSRHAYSGVNPDDGSGKPSVYLTKPDGTPSDNNTARPFDEAKAMMAAGIDMPMVITELGWLAGWNNLPSGWLTDLLRYNDLMLQHPNIVGSCVWNAGQWETAPNILSGKPLLDLGNQLSVMTPVFWNRGTVIEQPEPEPEPDQNDFDYIATAILLPQDASFLDLIADKSWADLVQEIDQYRRSIFWSHHDAVAAASRAQKGSKIVIYGDRPEAVALAEKYGIGVEIRDRPDKPEPPFSPFADFKMGQPLNVRWAITSNFNSNRSYGKHEGIDIDDATRTGNSRASVLATNSGKISKVLRHQGGYGLHVILEGDHNEFPFTITYAHLDKAYVEAGQFVEAGEPIGEIGWTGNVWPRNEQGEHLHITVQLHGYGLSGYVRSDVVDPRPFLPNPAEAGQGKPDPTPPPQGSGKLFDLVSYFTGAPEFQYMVKHYRPIEGTQERFRIDHYAEAFDINGKPTKGKFYIVKNSQWELYHYDSEWIYQDTDTSPGNDEYYTVRYDKGGDRLARRCPRQMRVGEGWIDRQQHYVEFFNKRTKQNSGSPFEGWATNTAEFISAGRWTSPDGIQYADVITVKMGTELQTLAKGIGPVAWEMADKYTAITKEDVSGQLPYARETI